MKRLHRNPAKYDVFDLFHLLADQNGYSVNGPTADEQLLDLVAKAWRRHKNNRRLIYGKRTRSHVRVCRRCLG